MDGKIPPELIEGHRVTGAPHGTMAGWKVWHCGCRCCLGDRLDYQRRTATGTTPDIPDPR